MSKPNEKFFKYRPINTRGCQYSEGIYYNKMTGKYMVRINDHWAPRNKEGYTKQKSMGYHDTIPAATMAWMQKKEEQINRYIKENQDDGALIRRLVTFKAHLWSTIYRSLEPIIAADAPTKAFIAIWKRHVYVGYGSDPIQFATKLPMVHTVFYNITDDAMKGILTYVHSWRIPDTNWYTMGVDPLLGILDHISKGYMSTSVPYFPEVVGPMFKKNRVNLVAHTTARETLPHMEGYPELKIRPDGPSYAKVFQHGVNDAPYYVVWVNQHGKRVIDKVYATWGSMLERVYTNRSPTYQDATVAPEWLSFMAFRTWYFEQDREEGDQLDKDLLYPGNKRYAPDTCVFLSPMINTFINSNDTAVNVKGYTYHSDLTKPYRAGIKITVNGVRKFKNLGCYSTEEEAKLAYIRARDRKFQQYIDKEKRPNVKQALETHRKLMWDKINKQHKEEILP